LELRGEGLKVCLESLIELYEYLTEQLVRLKQKVKELSESLKYRERVRLLSAVPGIGTLIAMEMLVKLQDVDRFRRAEELASFIGLTPSEFSTGQYVRQGRITRCGNKRVRTCLVESSWILIQKDPVIRLKYNKLKSKKEAKRAIIAITRSLLIRIRTMLLGREPYLVGVC
jgi:transposase